jgi:hypothetical protein
LWVDSRHGKEISLFSLTTRPALMPTRPPLKTVPEAPTLGVKRPGHEGQHSPPSSAKNKNGRLIPPLSNRLHGVALKYFSPGTILIPLRNIVFNIIII